ncbi:hypothetical protein N3K66_005254 [Trichothecium roseum]|uniref:Uncharacterized protein n=1 Tax=Trichothecium roseum TaxID=47278 RepID=A0ACC0V3W3_9HYPO|nr:hypothetical protein N3K66_005254 [Trichothecium roseum]
MAEHRHYATPDPQWVDFPNNLPEGTRICGTTKTRNPVVPQPGLDINEFDVKVRDGAPIAIRSYRKTDAQTSGPLLLYMHGGGYVTGSLDTDDSICRAIASETDLVVVNVDYRLAPEHKFPVGFEDCFDIVRWATTPAAQKRLGADLSKGFILGGTSAGANFTAGISHLAREENLPHKITGLVFLAGSFCHPDARGKYKDRILSVDEINDAPGLTRKSINYFAEKYGAPPEDKRLSPLLFESHKGIADKAYFAVCGWDPRRDEAILLDELLKEAGLLTRSDMYAGKPHGFWGSCPDLPDSKKWLEQLLDALRWMSE